ncbi:MAG: MYXO-CTERM sorting domain-containing protein [Minicystis sp.]
MRTILRDPDLRARRAGRVPASFGRIALLLSILFGAVLALPRLALAAGSVTLSTREPVEVDGRWKLNMTIDYGSLPNIPHIPMIFSFEPKVLYERALLDKTGDKPQLNKIPLQNQTTINESMDVGFADASGKVFKVTKFDFIIRRDHGFEAGEYELKIKRQDDGAQMGQTIRLILKGDNPIVDRRAITFAGEKPKKAGEKKDEEKKAEPAADEKKDEPAAEKKDEAADPNAAGAVPPVPPKQGGCGCLVAGDATPNGAGALAAAALAAAVVARRRRR